MIQYLFNLLCCVAWSSHKKKIPDKQTSTYCINCAWNAIAIILATDHSNGITPRDWPTQSKPQKRSCTFFTVWNRQSDANASIYCVCQCMLFWFVCMKYFEVDYSPSFVYIVGCLLIEVKPSSGHLVKMIL